MKRFEVGGYYIYNGSVMCITEISTCGRYHGAFLYSCYSKCERQFYCRPTDYWKLVDNDKLYMENKDRIEQLKRYVKRRKLLSGE